jgi:V/A-type H+-transporting ATPase subunit K
MEDFIMMESIIGTTLVLITMLPLALIIMRILTGKKAKYGLIANLISFFGVCGLFTIFMSTNAFAAGSTATAATAISDTSKGFGYIAASLAIGISTIASGIAVGPSASAAIGAVSEDPKSFGKSIILVALGETFALYGFIIAFQIISKL